MRSRCKNNRTTENYVCHDDSDFDLALVFCLDGLVANIHSQVGTWRYLAQKALEGGINFSRDAFLSFKVRLR